MNLTEEQINFLLKQDNEQILINLVHNKNIDIKIKELIIDQYIKNSIFK